MTGGELGPLLTVVVAATDRPGASAEARRAWESEAGGRIEVIVVPGRAAPRLRRQGLEAARGRVVAFTEDSCLARPGWADAWLAAFDDPALVAGSGTVDLDDRATTLDRAVVLCEYAPFLAGGAGRPLDRLAGNNFAVLREVALRLTGDEVHEVPLLAAIRREGGLARLVEGATVRHVRRFGTAEAFADRLRFGLEYGRLRTVGARPWARWAGLVAGPAIFASQAARLARTLAANPRHRRRSAPAVPLALALLLAWSLGEWLGWTLGPPRRESA